MLGFSVFTYSDYFEIFDKKSMVLNFGLSLLILALLQAYTANLAALLITQSNSAAPLNGIDDAVNKASVLCVEAGSYAQAVLAQSYPSITPYPTDDPFIAYQVNFIYLFYIRYNFYYEYWHILSVVITIIILYQALHLLLG